MNMQPKLNVWTRTIGALTVACCFGTAATRAGELDSQTNRVPNDFAAGNWANPAAWSAIPKYAADPAGDGSPADGYDWLYTQVAHDEYWIYLHYHNSHTFAGDRQLMYFDTDSNPDTGMRGFTGNLAVGAEYYFSGASLNKEGVGFVGYIENWVQDDDENGNWDIIVAIDRATYMPEVTSLNFVNQNHDQSGDDWYADNGNTLAGDWFRYELNNPTETAFGRDWTVFEPVHRDNSAVQADVAGATNSLTFDGIFGTTYHTAAVTALDPVVGTKVSYDFALTHELRDAAGDGNLDTWVAEAFGTFVSNPNDSSNAGNISTRVGARPFDGPPTRILHERLDEEEPVENSSSLEGNPLSDGVQIEWLFTSETTIEISVYSKDGLTLLGPKYTDTISSINDIHGFRFNLFDSEQTMTISDFTVEVVTPSIDGDFNGDGFVDAADLNDPVLGWKARFGVDLDGDDFLVWQRNLGAGTPPATVAAAAVPEPTTALLALMGIVGAVRISRRRAGFSR
jgi:hypothetical protein